MHETIKLVRIERDCPFNTQIREKGSAAKLGGGGRTNKLIFDFDVMVDGVKAATWKNQRSLGGYWLNDNGGEWVRDPSAKARREDDLIRCKSQERLIATFESNRSLIPSPAKIAEREADKAKNRAEAEAADAERHRIDRIKESGPELLKVLEDVLFHVEDEEAKRVGSQCTLCHSYRKMIRDVIAKAKGTE